MRLVKKLPGEKLANEAHKFHPALGQALHFLKIVSEERNLVIELKALPSEISDPKAYWEPTWSSEEYGGVSQ